MSYIAYDQKTKEFFSTSKRPSNQSSKKNLAKIGNRLMRYVLAHPEIELTELQKEFWENFKNAEKNGKKYYLSEDHINIAHGVAISKIIEYFVKILNDSDELDTLEAYKFVDATLSTESSEDDKGRNRMFDFFVNVKNSFLKPLEAVKEANEILKILNRSTRNLYIGHDYINQGIQEYEDPLVFMKKGSKDKVQIVKYYVPISNTF